MAFRHLEQTKSPVLGNTHPAAAAPRSAMPGIAEGAASFPLAEKPNDPKSRFLAYPHIRLYRDAVRAERIPDGRHERERVHDHRDGVFRVAAAIDGQRHGCGGTKEEMQRLLIDAEKLSGIKYDISSYADIVDAIHVVQTEMGITGTTALEASTTIQGSVAANTPLVR